ncbi:major tail protein [Vibrio phage 1.215.B._10N.222.54.F7]|nr:major tail protein [Vibrio phage 1.215.A._10N.222.54.F7]AUR96099.1 major tail protein [Vibrio phage 1.215.B._10N.222.54.F7]
MANNVESFYYSGQGVVMLAEYDENHNLLGYRPIGNVNALSIGIETTRTEHRESQTGARGIDRVITTEVNANVSMTIENFIQENLALGLYGSSAVLAAATDIEQAAKVRHLGMVEALVALDVTNVVVTDVLASPTITYELDKNYRVNTDAGSIYWLTVEEQTAAGAANVITATDTVAVKYDHGEQKVLQGLETSNAPVRALRFEGLNTVENNSPVVVEIYKFETAPLAEYALINEEIANIELSGNALADNSRTKGSRYFRQLSAQ